jgi:hypothetical protein
VLSARWHSFFTRRADDGDGRLLWITIHYGERMRAWIDVGFSIESEQ